jgi:F-type H+-transporting ATPase subunit h
MVCCFHPPESIQMQCTHPAPPFCAHADSVQDLYLMELKVYEPAPKAAPPRPRIFTLSLTLKNSSTTLSPSSQVVKYHVSPVKVFFAPALPQAPTFPADLASELAQYDATKPVSTSSATTADAGHIAPRTAETEAFLSSLEVGVPKDEAHHWTTLKQTPAPPCFL